MKKVKKKNFKKESHYLIMILSNLNLHISGNISLKTKIIALFSILKQLVHTPLFYSVTYYYSNNLKQCDAGHWARLP